MSAAQSDASADRNSGDPTAASRDRKSGLSCAECRRSKLKCDSLLEYTLSGDNTTGTLAATKGNKVLMAHAQRLSEQVKSMSARIKELELALAESQSPGLLHPLLQPSSDSGSAQEGSRHESPDDPDLEGLSEVIGSLSIGNDGKSKYHGETAGVEAEFKADIVDHIYMPDGSISLTNIHPHRLCIFFLELAGGVFWDTHPSAGILSEQYHALARAAFSVASIVKEASIATVQALYMHSVFAYITDRTKNEERWLMNGLTAKLAQTIGLQRDSAKWGLSPDEVEKRRHVFWDFFTWETWVSLVNGRPPTLILEHTDCRFPQDREPFVTPSGETHIGLLIYTHRSYLAQALRDSPADPLSHKYGPSVLAAYEASRHVLQGLRQVYALHPEHISRIWYFWTGAFSACVIMGVIVTRSPGCSIAQRALSELDELRALFEEGSVPCRPAGTVAVLNKLQRRAYTTFVDFHANPDFARNNKEREEELSRCDEFAVMGGTQQIIKEEPVAAGIPPEDHAPIPFAARSGEGSFSSMAGFGGAFTPSPFGEPSVVGSAAFMDHFVKQMDFTQFSRPAAMDYGTEPSLYPCAQSQAPMGPSSFTSQPVDMQSDQQMSMDTVQDDMWWDLVQDLGLNHS
ncbi:hypothetical protein EWM64_g8991 [Hericium alpestre]|uniref:Xylanolytic transcriptional activator regulatory domain-containing protein n=1 Tax=Hericium alpestre TaxID=135208 RepID=A0A4Y9ZJV4_9AGAM|nr:hypothetical protein EWM64_g8991 [Hericium alpestre]